MKERFDAYANNSFELQKIPKWQYMEMRDLFFVGFMDCFQWVTKELRTLTKEQCDEQLNAYKQELMDYSIEQIHFASQAKAERNEED